VTKICIIGAGWYGCHIGVSLKTLGFDVTVFEKNNQILSGASGNNQSRLHQGFHYPRHHNTRIQSRDGFIRFMDRYPDLSRKVPDNFYAVSHEESLMDFPTYRLVMTSSGLNFQEAHPPGLRDVDGVLVVDERVLLTELARRYFVNRLGNSLVANVAVKTVEPRGERVEVNGDLFDWVVDATWATGRLGILPIQVYYEPTMLLYYETDHHQPAVTLVDGPLCSVYPTEDSRVYTLSSVPHTPLGRSSSAAEALAIRNNVGTELVAAKRQVMEDQITRYLPDFRERFRFMGPQLSLKTKPMGEFDDRSCYVFRQGKIFTVMSGKIDTIFFALDHIISELST
jgi:hypothetical protein